jgi:hypothetical protein
MKTTVGWDGLAVCACVVNTAKAIARKAASFTMPKPVFVSLCITGFLSCKDVAINAKPTLSLSAWAVSNPIF